MPILAPDRNKGKIAAAIMQTIRPSMADQMRMAGEESVMPGGENEEAEDAGQLALRAMFSAAQDGDFEGAWTALKSAVKICASC